MIRLVRANLDLLHAALAGDDSLARALVHDVVAGWATFTKALQLTRDALATDPGGAACGTRFFLTRRPARARRLGRLQGSTWKRRCRQVTGVLTLAGRTAPALVLIHQLDGGADQWDDFVPYLHQAGFSTLAYDGRGGLDERELVKEAEGAVAFLERRNDIDRGRLGIVGASIGANTTALALARDRGRRVPAGVALSPGDPSIIHRLQAAGRYHPRRVLILADPEEFPVARRFARGAVASRALKSSNYGHGVNLLGHNDDRAQVMRWLIDHVR